MARLWSRVSRLFGRDDTARVRHVWPRVAGRYDAAATTAENMRHWSGADQLSPDAGANAQVRRTLRSRARYEVANNCYAAGIVDTLVNYVVGTGARLQMLTPDDDANRVIEREFARWATAISLPARLRTMRRAQCESGEVFALLATNPALDSPVQLDVRLIEADRVSEPWTAQPTVDDRVSVDGVVVDRYGNPVEYRVLRRHPGDAQHIPGVGEYDAYPADVVIHLYTPGRPGQMRGVPELTPALPLFALLRRYTLAVLTSAEQAALPSGVIYTDAPAHVEPPDLEPRDTVELNRGSWMVIPYGWKIGQVRAEQPTTMYAEFKRELLNEIARVLNMPYNIAACNSSGYNYSSGRLDHQAFARSVRIHQQQLETLVLDRILRAWIGEAVLVEGLLPQSARTLNAYTYLPHQWFWDGLEHVDPYKEASAQARRLASHTTTLAAEYARQGLDWESELRQRAREVELMRELGLARDLSGGDEDMETE